MSELLSIAAAASECPTRVALIADARALTYAELASRADDVTLPTPNLHRANDALSSAIILYASLQQQRSVALVSKSSSDTEFVHRRAILNAADLSHAALVLFTSGSSGASKGVLLSRNALQTSATAAGTALGWADDDRWLCCLPLSHIGGISVLTRALVARKTAILCDGFDAASIAKDIVKQRATHISLVPTMLWRLLETGFRPPTHLRITLMGGAALDEGLAKRARSAGFLLRPSYGMTETSSMVLCDGHPLPGVALRIDANQGLHIRAPMLMNGYLPPNDTETPISNDWFSTADRARLINGHFQILGRSDATIISGGENIDLGEIESALNSHPNVHASLAVGIADPEWGQRLVALVVCDGDPSELQVAELSGHKRPKNILKVDGLPLLENGKPDRQRAMQLAIERNGRRA